MDRWSKTYGDIYGMYNGDVPFLMVKDLELLRQVFVTDFAMFMNRGDVWATMNGNPELRNTLPFAKSDRWKFLRRTVSIGFTASKMRRVLFAGEGQPPSPRLSAVRNGRSQLRWVETRPAGSYSHRCQTGASLPAAFRIPACERRTGTQDTIQRSFAKGRCLDSRRKDTLVDLVVNSHDYALMISKTNRPAMTRPRPWQAPYHGIQGIYNGKALTFFQCFRR
ncbi:lithocholate 6-beta-hydroxylase-like [Dermacentor albipictus]|uniref:lithocholate 6-beta-hydroxylase-like n=1 Tax=Dermacentor albipictus TaxID=60249 RepID=UPI0031FD9AD3